MSAPLLLLPVACTVTGWLVVRLLLYLLFRNILPRHRSAIALKLGNAAQELFDIDALAAQLQDPAALAGVMPSIETHIDAFLQTRLQEKIPVIATFIGGSTLKKLKEGLMEEIELLLPEVIAQYAGNVRSRIDVGRLVADRVAVLPPEALERQVRQTLAAELGQLQWMAAGIGLLTGLAAAGISLLLQI